MTDRRRHRGAHPQDARLFSPEALPSLREAVRDLCWLRSRGYAEPSAIAIVGNRYRLTARQRSAVVRCSCSDEAAGRRRSAHVMLDEAAGQRLGIDGYNLLICVESALAGGVVLIGQDRCRRDLASIHGTYRRVEETGPALTLIINYLAGYPLAGIDWYLDTPVSNSGRLKTYIAELLAASATPVAPWNIELRPDPDEVLAEYPGIVATSDSVILDRCRHWTNLAGAIIDACVLDAWVADLGDQGR